MIDGYLDPLAGRLGGIVPSATTRGGVGPRVLLFPGALMRNETQSMSTCSLEVEGWSRRERRAVGRRIECAMISPADPALTSASSPRYEGAMISTTQPPSASDLFDNLVPAGIASRPAAARELNAIYGFKIGGEGEWTVDCTANPPTCVRGDTGKAQCRITVSGDDFKKVIADPNAAMQLYFQGKLLVSGDPMLAMKLSKLVDLAK